VTCQPSTTVLEAEEAARLAGVDNVLVVDSEHRLFGRVKFGASKYDLDAVVEDVMEPGPPTVRAHEPLEALFGRMDPRGIKEMLVSTPEGYLLGVVRREV